MTKSSWIWLTLALILVLPSAVSGAPALEPIGKQQKLKPKDDQGRNLILHNADRFRLKWHIADESPYQHFQAYRGRNGLVYFIAFDYVMAVDEKGRTRWKRELPSELNRIDAVGDDGSFYRIYQGNMNYADETSMIVDRIVRVGADGIKRVFAPTTAHAPKDENGFAVGYPVYYGDAQGNLLWLSGEGLVAYRSDGSIGWRRGEWLLGDAAIDALDIVNVFADDRGRAYAQTSDLLFRLDDKGDIAWSVSTAEAKSGYFYIDEEQRLASWSFDMSTYSYRTRTYAISDNGIGLVPGKSAEPLYGGISDQRGGTYELDEKTNTVLNRDRNGKVKWKYSLTKKDVAWGRSLAEFTLKSDNAGNVYFSANVGTVYSLDPNGKPRFIVEMGNRYSLYSNILPITDKLTVIMIDNQILCIEQIK